MSWISTRTGVVRFNLGMDGLIRVDSSSTYDLCSF